MSSWSSTEIGVHDGKDPKLVSSACVDALFGLVQDNRTLAVVTEASSHPSGTISLWAQPDVYAGGGLGNYDECPLQFCLAGGVRRDSFTHAAVCVPHECTAYDLDAPNYLAHLERAVATATDSDNVVAQDYLNLQVHVHEMNALLYTGWTCGNFEVPWNVPWTIVYTAIVMVLMLLGVVGTYKGNKQRQLKAETAMVHRDTSYSDNEDEEKKENTVESLVRRYENYTTQESSKTQQQRNDFWSAFDLRENLNKITKPRTVDSTTSCLDGLRVGSILWIVLGHVMAIESSAGAGYNNPIDFLPPHGLTTTLGGQLLFASRFAVDTFLFISGFLVVRVLSKIPMVIPSASREPMWAFWKYLTTIPGLVLHRILRILPLYGISLGFWIVVAPHLGGGPFWYEWLGLLKPCAEYGWTNWLFVNNFIPADLANTETCFYHSWYLAIDVQLFLLAPLLVYGYRQSPVQGRRATAALCAISVAVTMYLSCVRKWSINTFDGAAVARFDVEGYAKPHVRAQSYLSGMLLAMYLGTTSFGSSVTTNIKHRVVMVCALVALAIVTFATVTGAYSRRPCRYGEWPTTSDCGSTWSPAATFWYAAAGRAVWSCAIFALAALCMTGHGGVVASILDCPAWTPLSHLSYGAYLVHPILIFVWQLSDTQKDRFSLLSIGMDYIAVTVVSFAVALVLALLVELPCATLQKGYLGRKFLTSKKETPNWSESDSVPLVPQQQSSELSNKIELYGAVEQRQTPRPITP